MRRFARRVLAAALLAVAGSAAAVLAQESDRLLPPGEGRETVEAICSACHSIRLVTQQKLSRERWDEVLGKMVKEQGMPELDAGTRESVLDYLAGNFGGGKPREQEGPSPFNRPAPLPQ